jgi:hypothetical protein
VVTVNDAPVRGKTYDEVIQFNLPRIRQYPMAWPLVGCRLASNFFGPGHESVAGAVAFQTGAEDVTIDTSFEQALSSLSSPS